MHFTPQENNKPLSKRKEEWSSKRMSRSFDDDALASLYNEGKSDGNMKPSRKGLAPLPLDDVLKQSEVLARLVILFEITFFSSVIDSE